MKSQRKPRRRLAAATVELAFTLPIMLTVVFGTIEVCQRIFLRQAATLTAYEGARLAVRRTATTQQVRQRCEALLIGRRVVNGTVSISPNSIESQPIGTPIQITVTVPWAANSPIRFVTGNASDISVVAVMVRE